MYNQLAVGKRGKYCTSFIVLFLKMVAVKMRMLKLKAPRKSTFDRVLTVNSGINLPLQKTFDKRISFIEQINQII